MIICIVSMMGSFGPVVALSNLSNNLNQTLASGERVLALLEEEPVVYEIKKSSEAACDNISNENTIDSIEVKNISFAYESRKIFDNF